MPKNKQPWKQTIEQGLHIRETDTTSVRKIMSRLRHGTGGPEPEPDESARATPDVQEVSPPHTLDRSKIYTGAEFTPVQLDTVPKSTPVQNLHRSILEEPTVKAGFVKVPNDILDNLLPRLTPTEAIIFLRIFRLTVGFNRSTCLIGTNTLSRTCNISENTCRTALRRLLDLKIIEQVEVINTKEIKGSVYKIISPENERPVQKLHRSKNYTGPKSEPITENDDELDMTYHHQKRKQKTDDDPHIDSPHVSQVMTCYQEITGNAWTAKDTKAYTEIATIPVTTIEAAIRVAFSRAPAPPRSFAYFIPEIKTQHEPPRHNRVGNKKQLREIAEEVRTRFVGYSLSVGEFAEQIKHLAANRGINYGGGVLDEVLAELERKKS